MSDDEELQLAIEISKQTFASEQALHSNDSDLIRFESPDEPKRREQIQRIKQLYERNVPSSSTAPVAYGFRTSFDDSSSLGALPHSPSFPYNYYTTYQAPTHQIPPPRPPKPPQFQSRQFPPNPSLTLLRENPPPPLPPRSNRIPIPSRPSSSTPLRHSAPDFFFEKAIEYSPIKIDTSFASESSNNDSTVNDSSSQYQPLTHLYVPYTMTNLNYSYGGLMNGDLIDLSNATMEEAGNVSLETIRKEFDPLYVTFSYDTMPSLQIHHSKKVDEQPKYIEEPVVEPIHQMPKVAFNLEKCEDVIETQIKKVCRRNLLSIQKTPQFFIAPTVDYMTTAKFATTVKVIIYKNQRQGSDKTCKAMTCDIEETVELIAAKAVSLLEPNLPNDGKVYGLKIYGSNQFLSQKSLLGANLYTGHCLLHGEDVKLELAVIEPDTRVCDQQQLDTWSKMKSQIRYATVVDKEDVENTLSHLNKEMIQYEKAFNEGSTLRLSQTSQRVKQVVMLFCKCLHGIVPEKMYNDMQKYLTSTTQDQLDCNRFDFLKELHNFLGLFCKCTVSQYTLPSYMTIEKPREEVLSHMDCLQIMLNSVHSVPEKWIRDYSDFYMSVDLYYGTQVLDGHSNKLPKTIRHDQFFPRIALDLYAKFTRLTLCTYPRETRVVVSISGTLKPGAQPQTITSSEDPETEMLAYCSVPLYDEKLAMRQGALYVPLTLLRKNPVLKPFGPYPYINDARDPILIMTFKVWPTEIFFPNVTLELQCIPQDFSMLDMETREYIMELIENQDPSRLEQDDQDLIWQKRFYLTNQPEALPLVLASLADWSYGFLTKVYQILEEWAVLKPEIAMQLLLPQYPDERVRAYAVQWLACGSTDFLFHSIPQFIEALRFELYEKSTLADFINELASISMDFAFEIYWQLQQRVDHCAVDDLPYAIRCQNLQQKIVDEHENTALRNDIKLQHDLLSELDSIQDDLRSRANDSEPEKLFRLTSRLGNLDSKLLQNKVRLPICPSFDCTGIRVEECSIFNSNAKPLKIVFRGINSNYSIIHKRDDDMRQDAFVMKMVNEMDRIWKSNDLDLRIITFRIMPVGYRRGMGELVLNCATLMEIQKEDGLRGVLNDEVLRKWLIKHNSNEFSYKEAQDNFIRSCAGWCIVTYVLGIGDRHNDNILFTKNGHVFHIDFGKYMGDWQTAAGFRRDRVPFVFTSEMSYVINDGKTQKQKFQTFIDYCCQAFNHLRSNKNTLTNLLRIMACSDIAGINLSSISFVEKNLMLHLSDTDATIQFTEMVQNSLKSAFPRLNFVAHTVAQFVSAGSTFSKRDDNKLHFIPDIHTELTDGRLKSVTVVTFEKRYIPNKIYLYKFEVCRENEAISSFIYRSFEEFDELHGKLRKRYPTKIFPLDRSTNMRSNTSNVARKRFIDVQKFFRYLYTQPEIFHSDLVCTFCHSILRDSDIDTYIDTEDMSSHCQIYLKIQHNRNKETLSIFVGHVKNLAIPQTGLQPDAYVKTYVKPDLQNHSKRKTQVVRSTQNPTFNQELCYENFQASLLPSRVLEVSIWNNGGLMDNYKMYLICIPLLKIHNIREDRKGIRVLEGWHQCSKYI